MSFAILCREERMKSQEVQFRYIFTNYRKQKALIEELKIEPMTQLYNKAALEGCMSAYLKKFIGGSYKPTVVIMDIDYIKNLMIEELK